MARRASLSRTADVALTPAGWVPPTAAAASAEPPPTSPYMSSLEAAIFTRRVRADGTANRGAFRAWAIRHGVRTCPGDRNRYRRRDVELAMDGRLWPGDAEPHAGSLGAPSRARNGRASAKAGAKPEDAMTFAMQLRVTLRRAGHTASCLNAMTLEEADAQLEDGARAEAWCASHGCRLRYRRLQWPAPVPEPPPAGGSS